MFSLLMAVTLAATPAWKTFPPPGPMPAAPRHGLAEVNGIRLYFAIYGVGEPLILLHGGAGNADHWVNQLAAFAEKYQVIVVDSRGHGRSTRDSKPITYEQMADDVIALMDQLEIEKAAMVGWSDGGATAIDLAIRHPARVSKLVAFATNYDLKGTQKGGGPAFSAYFARCAADYAKISPTPGDYKGLQVALRPMWRTLPNYTSAQISSIKAPTLVLDGDHDEIIRQDHVKELARLISGARLVLIPDSSHFAMFQQPVAFNQAVLGFLQSR
ncbi:MAG: alpha/beta hydrolase [Archangium sp.]|nr:alpha/beta hydrolase [Archangium sp.]MDP3569667.1 alpha/beta hydrolase [Archangium sp.]